VTTHSFDPFALLIGAIVTVVGILLLGDADMDGVPGWLIPTTVLVIGAVLAMGALRRSRDDQPAVPAAPAAPSTPLTNEAIDDANSSGISP
jgi:hypothetical protein